MALNIKQICPMSSIYKNAPVEDGYRTIEINNIIKLGYMCEEKAQDLPIYLKINGTYEKFYIGKTRIFEVSNVNISGIKLPDNIYFTLDYICEE